MTAWGKSDGDRSAASFISPVSGRKQIMLRPRYKKAVLWVSFGMLLGLVAGLAVHFGLESRDSAGSHSGLPLEELKLRAMATHGSDTFAMATGPADENVDALFTLDYLTG